MVIFDWDKCIGCGMCVRDCFPRCIEIIDKKAHFIEDHNCMECGHCIAICPKDAVSIERLDMGEVLELTAIPHDIDPNLYVNHLKARRSIRSFKPEPATSEQIEMILDAGRFSPTGGNRQNVSYHIYRDNIAELRSRIMEELKAMGDEAQETGSKVSWYSDLWLDMYDDYKANGTDRLFFDAGTVIVVSSDVPQAATIASAHMETMVYALGLGMLYSGFSVRAITHSEELRRFIGLKDNYTAWTVLVIGYPKPRYLRTVPREEADVVWD